MNVMNLEMDDYLKTVENLNDKLQKKQAQCEELEQAAQTFTEKHNTLENEIGNSTLLSLLNKFNIFTYKLLSVSQHQFQSPI